MLTDQEKSVKHFWKRFKLNKLKIDIPEFYDGRSGSKINSHSLEIIIKGGLTNLVIFNIEWEEGVIKKSLSERIGLEVIEYNFLNDYIIIRVNLMLMYEDVFKTRLHQVAEKYSVDYVLIIPEIVYKRSIYVPQFNRNTSKVEYKPSYCKVRIYKGNLQDKKLTPEESQRTLHKEINLLEEYGSDTSKLMTSLVNPTSFFSICNELIDFTKSKLNINEGL